MLSESASTLERPNSGKRLNYKYSDGVYLTTQEYAERISQFGHKYLWFLEHGYAPHYWQTLWHTLQTYDDRLARFRHLVAGRRGGKTIAAAWEVLYYCLHPRQFHWDVHRSESERPLHVWVLTKDYPLGRAAWQKFVEVIRTANLTPYDVKENRSNKFFEFSNGSLVEFKTADDPESLRGAGLDILWMDETAFIPTREAYLRVRPALSDKEGIVLTSTTPSGKNWFYTEFWSDDALQDPDHGRVEYRSLDNPYFPKKEWALQKRTYHPLLFKQEYMAAFDSMAGKELSGDWLKYYEIRDLPRDKDNPKNYDLRLFMGVDPAISLADEADRFVMSLLGVTKDSTQVYLLEQWAGRVPFPDQVDLIAEWHQKYRPQLIGIESNAYQAALSQQVSRLESLPPVVPIITRGQKKEQRILAMAPLFKIGKVRIRQEHRDFIDEWLDYDSTVKNPHDDCLDSVEIALQTAGALLPIALKVEEYDPDKPISDINELARRSRPGGDMAKQLTDFDPHMGEDY